jgi:hypothetical protein
VGEVPSADWRELASFLPGNKLTYQGVAPVNGQDAAPPGYDLHQQYPAGMQQPPSLQDPASGAAQQLYGFMSKYAGQ